MFDTHDLNRLGLVCSMLAFTVVKTLHITVLLEGKEIKIV